ncbi:hypothetical protein Tco_0779122 [Tanacetum coccineum]
MRIIKMTMPKMQLNSKFVNNMLPEWGRFVSTVKLNRGLLFRIFRVDRTEVKGIMLGEQLQLGMGEFRTEWNGTVLDEEQSLFIAGGQTNTFDDNVDEEPVQDSTLNEDNIFQADQCDAFDSDVNEAPTAQTMFMANLSLSDPIYDEAGPLYDSNK